MHRRHTLPCLLAALLLLVACGGTPAAPTANIAATQTRTAEVGQLATLTAPTAAPPAAPTATPLTSATQTRVAELSQLATLTAPTAAPPPPSATVPVAATPAPTALNKGNLVGTLDASDAFIGIVVTGTEVMAYVCDGANLAQWFTGTLQGDRINLTAANGASLAAEVRRPAGGGDLQAANGSFRSAEGRTSNFTSAATGNLGNSGLYRGTGTVGSTNLTMGVIVLPDGRLRGVLRAGQFLLPVTDPTFAANGLTATFDEFGPVTALRLGT